MKDGLSALIKQILCGNFQFIEYILLFSEVTFCDMNYLTTHYDNIDFFDFLWHYIFLLHIVSLYMNIFFCLN